MFEEPEELPTSIRARIGWSVFGGLLLIIMGAAVFLSSVDDPTPTLYHRTDGTFSLNQPDGPNVTPGDVLDYLRNYESFGRVRLVCNSQTQLRDWNPYLNSAGEAGAPFHQLESGGKVFSFTLPGGGWYSEDLNSDFSVINLSDMTQPPLDEARGADVVILVNPGTTCDVALEAAEDFKGQYKTILIIGYPEPDPEEPLSTGQQYVSFRHEKHDEMKHPTFKRKHSKFWNDHIQPTLDRIGKLF